jgi:hypothetical protein
MNYMMKGSAMLTAAQVLRLITTALCNFRPMDSHDSEAFSGTDSPKAMIHYADEFSELYTIILDGNRVCLIDGEGVESHYVLGENVLA